jgi:hypothetical protein
MKLGYGCEVNEMLTVKGVYEDNEVKLLEPLNIEGKHIVEIRFIETDPVKKRVTETFRKARGIWKDRPEVDDIFKEIREDWEEWRKELEKYYN